MTITDQDRYLFDLQGYLVLRDVLSSDEVADLNARVDANVAEPSNGQTRAGLWDLFDWGEPFRTLLDHPRVLPYLEEWVDPAMRVDLVYGQMQSSGETSKHTDINLHGGGSPSSPLLSYSFRDGHPQCGLTVVSWALTDSPDGAGGFVVVPGSHKSSFPFLPGMRKHDVNPDGAVQQPVLRAGDAVIFTEGIAHGTVPWTLPTPRRVVYYRYTPGFMLFEPVEWKESALANMTQRQRRLFEPPYGRTPDYTPDGRRKGQTRRRPVSDS